ncbi:MAG: class I SAM-dependent methyltransferase [Bacilli bacterium]|jgi:tRNA (adenine22-N1)-methyltransferase
MNISGRLLAIASLVPQDATVADIGSDHGLLIDHLSSQGRIDKGYATDNKAGPFRRLMERFRNEPRISAYQADGLTGLPADVDTIVIAGMGGLLINRILIEGRSTLHKVKHIIISPHQQVAEVRQTMMNLGYKIEDELIVSEDNQFYEAISFVHGVADYSEKELRYGPLNLARHTPELIAKLKARLETIERLLKKNLPAFRLAELHREKEWIQQYDQNL